MAYIIDGTVTLKEKLNDGKETTKEIKIFKSKLTSPKGSWLAYINTNISSRIDCHEINGGTLKLWKELRIPTPWLYFYARALLHDTFVFDKEKNRFTHKESDSFFDNYIYTKKTSWGFPTIPK